jgi:hypothetical protein
VARGIGAEAEPAVELLLDFQEQLCPPRAGARMALTVMRRGEALLRLARRRISCRRRWISTLMLSAERAAAAAAVGAVDEHRRLDALVDALAGHLEQAQRRDGQDVGAGLVLLQGLLDRVVDHVAVLLLPHVDQVDDQQAADVAQAQLAGDLLDGLEVDLEDGLVLVGAAPVLAGVDVDGDERLGLVDDDGAARGQADLAAEGVSSWRSIRSAGRWAWRHRQRRALRARCSGCRRCRSRDPGDRVADGALMRSGSW